MADDIQNAQHMPDLHLLRMLLGMPHIAKGMQFLRISSAKNDEMLCNMHSLHTICDPSAIPDEFVLYDFTMQNMFQLMPDIADYATGTYLFAKQPSGSWRVTQRFIACYFDKQQFLHVTHRATPSSRQITMTSDEIRIYIKRLIDAQICPATDIQQ